MTTINDPQRKAQTIEQLLGPQTITITGVPATSHFARVLVAADYRMKRLGMKLDPPPIPGLPSYVDMIRPSTPRHAKHDAALVDGAQLRPAADRRQGPGLGNSPGQRQGADRRNVFRRARLEGPDRQGEPAWPKPGPTTLRPNTTTCR